MNATVAPGQGSSRDADEDFERAIAEEDRLRSERTGHEAIWANIDSLVQPNGNPTYTASDGAQARERMLDNTPEDACEMAAAGLQALLVSKALRWHDIGVMNQRLARDTDGGSWLERATDATLSIFNAPQSRFYTAWYMDALEILAKGSGCIYWEERPGRLPLARKLPLADVVWDEDGDGEVDRLYHRYTLTPHAAASRYGRENLPEAVQKMLDVKGQTQRVDFICAIEPREKRDPRKRDRANMPFRQLVLMPEYNHLVKRGGHPDFPAVCTRINKRARELYGRWCGHKALGDADLLMRMTHTTVTAAELVIAPPIARPDEGIDGDVDMRPGGYTTVDREYMAQGVMPKPIATGGQPGIGLDLIEDRRRQIRRAFLEELLKLIIDAKATATHVLGLQEEQARGRTPVLTQFEEQNLDPHVRIVWGICNRSGLVEAMAGPAPPELVGQPMQPGFGSPAMRAQAVAHARSIFQGLEAAAGLIQTDPALLDHVDTDAALRLGLTGMGMPASAMRALSSVAQMRLARQEDERNRAAVEAAKDITVAAKNAAPALKVATDAGWLPSAGGAAPADGAAAQGAAA